jgi:hypothetical protein
MAFANLNKMPEALQERELFRQKNAALTLVQSSHIAYTLTQSHSLHFL